MAERQRGEFFYPKELRERVDIPRPLLLQLGKACLLFTQTEASFRYGQPVPRRHESYTIFRYHLQYVEGVVAKLDLGLQGDERDAQFIEYAAAHTDLMADAMNRYYERIFEAAGDQRRPDGRPYLSRDQACAVLDLSPFKTNSYFDRTYEAPGKRPTWDPETLARVFDWEIPGSPETVQQVRDGLSELATQYAGINRI